MKKPAFVLRFVNIPTEREKPVSRERVAYLLRAARSRRSDILRNGRCYRLIDCGVRISAA